MSLDRDIRLNDTDNSWKHLEPGDKLWVPDFRLYDETDGIIRQPLEITIDEYNLDEMQDKLDSEEAFLDHDSAWRYTMAYIIREYKKHKPDTKHEYSR